MALTIPQIITLKADIMLDPVLDEMRMTGRDRELCDIYNADTTDICWKKKVLQDEIMQNGFDWTRVDNLTVGKSRIWEWLFNNGERAINPSKVNVRAGIDSTWVGTAPDLAVRAAVYVHCKRFVTKFEKLFAQGAGTSADPSVLVVEGPISVYDMSMTRNNY
jgi:hypothetical protein